MPLLFKKPQKSEKRLKAMLFGLAGVGKTTAAIQFPRPAVIDTELGTVNDQYVDLIESRGGAVLQTTSFDTMLDQVRSLAVEEHDFQTLVIDPVTVIYDGLADSWEKRVGSDWSAHHAKARTDWKRLTAMLSTLDMNVVWTAHAKAEWINGEATGRLTYDGPKGADFWVDLLIEVRRDGETRNGLIRKSRIKGLEVDTEFAFSYDEIAERYGRDVLERNAVPVSEDLVRLMELIGEREDGQDLGSRMMKKAGVSTLSELTADQVEKAIEWLTNG
jgi:hypothetical protein